MLTRRLLVSVGLSSLVALAFVVYFLLREERVVSAVRDVPAGAQLMAEDLGHRVLVRRDVHPSAVRSIDEAAGRFALTSLVAGEVLLSEKLGASPPPPQLFIGGVPVDPAMLLVGIPARPELAAGGLIEAGDLVSLIWVPEGGPDGVRVAHLFAHRLRVAAVVDEGGEMASPGRRAAGQATADPLAVVVVAEPAMATEIAARLSSGTVLIMLAHPRAPDLELPVSSSLPAQLSGTD